MDTSQFSDSKSIVSKASVNTAVKEGKEGPRSDFSKKKNMIY
jgi:hypothetical protein